MNVRRTATVNGQVRDNAGFRRLWASVGVSVIGSEITVLAMPLTAVAVLDASAVEVALLSAAGTAPFLLFGLPAGSWVDRWPRRRVMVRTDWARGLLLGSVPLAYGLGLLTMPHLAVVAFAVGALGVFFDIASLSALPALLPRRQLAAANGSLEAVRAVGQTSGPALGGVIVQAVTAPLALIVDAVSFALSAVLLRGLPEIPAPPKAVARQPLRREVAEGIAYCFRDPVIRSLAGGGAWLNYWTHALLGVFVVHAVRNLDQSPGAIGLVLAVSNLGYLFGSLLVPRFNQRLGVGATIIAGVVLHGGLIAVALAPLQEPVPWEIAGFALHAVGVSLWNVNAVSLRQALTPEVLMARMTATTRFLLWGAMPLGALTGGLLATTVGLGAAVAVSAMASPLVALPLWRSALRQVRSMPEEADAKEAAAT